MFIEISGEKIRPKLRNWSSVKGIKSISLVYHGIRERGQLWVDKKQRKKEFEISHCGGESMDYGVTVAMSCKIESDKEFEQGYMSTACLFFFLILLVTQG